MVVVSLRGGLGNQLFQYATGRALSVEWGTDLALDLGWFNEVVGKKGVTVREYSLVPFALPVRTQCTDRLGAGGGRLYHLVARLCRLVSPAPRSQFRVVKERAFDYSPEVFGARGSVWLDGYWQSWRYFAAIEPLLRAELSTPKVMSLASRQMLERIRSASTAVCLHVRRGDYVSSPSAASFHGTCDVDYYLRAVAELNQICRPTCFIFSDDADWVRGNLSFPCESVVVDINGPADAHQDLWLMANCEHFVIANSSLSWWGAWLGASPRKQVFAPRHWFREQSRSTADLIPPGWRRL